MQDEIEKDGQSLLVVLVPLAAIPECHAHANAHESEWRNQEDEHASADGALSVFRSARCIRVTHGTTLRERGSAPQRKSGYENEQSSSHFTPR